MKLRIKSTKLTLQVISWIQIVGGITGLGLIAYLMLKTGAISGAVLLIFTIGIGIFGYSIYSGKRLLTDATKNTAIILSVINQAIQVFQWSMLGYGFSYSSGVELILGVQEQTFCFNFAVITSTFEMSFNSNNDFFIKVNLIAILLIVVLFNILNELKKEKTASKLKTSHVHTY
jgi:hypothetical protein